MAKKNEAIEVTVEIVFEVAQTVIYMAAGDLNEAGAEALEAYRDTFGEVPTFKIAGEDVEHLPIGVNFPYPEGGIEQYIDPAFLAKWKEEWNASVMGRGIKVELNLDKFIKGQARIDLNRDRTPVAYKKYGKDKAAKAKGAPSKVKPVANNL